MLTGTFTMGIKILAVGAHPDDVEIGCFGTLDACVKRGDTVIVCSLTNGNLGHNQLSKEELERDSSYRRGPGFQCDRGSLYLSRI